MKAWPLHKMKLQTMLRVLAVACFLASVPVSCLKYPWLPATALEFADLRQDPYPGGSQSYHQDRARRLASTRQALALYAFGAASQIGLCLIIAGRGSRALHLAAWTLAAVTGFGIAQFERPHIDSSTDPAFTIMTVHIPSGIAAFSAAAALATVVPLIAERRRGTAV